MALEIEIKARIASPDSIKTVLHSQFGPGVFLRRKDQYFRRSQDRFDHIRLREENEKAIITFKDKKISQGIEENLEIQFCVDNKKAFTEFLEKLDFSPAYSKEKTVQAFFDRRRNLVFELVHIPLLGWFIEIETVINEQQQGVHNAHSLVKQALMDLGLEEKDIESRSYKVLLEEAEKTS